MRYISADYIFPITSDPLKDGVIELSDEGIVLQILNPESQILNSETKIEKHVGIICPGFINSHCHLELSHMKGAIPEKTGMAGFIKNMVAERGKFSKEQIQKGIEDAENEMIANGIVAVGDISNDDSTFETKKKENLKYYTFLEVFDINPDKANDIFKQSETLRTSNLELRTSISPHAPYTVSGRLFALIADHAKKNNSVISYHNQENIAESELYINKTGAIAEQFSKMGIDMSHFEQTGKNSLLSTLPYFSNSNKTVLVHNTFTSEDDIFFAEEFFQHPKINQQLLYWCFCPSANLYIENKLPDFQIFFDTNAHCVIGTDSLASNHQLNILEELKIISKNAAEIPLEVLLTWATLNGAQLLGFDDELGSIEEGKKPGLVLIENVDLENLQLTAESKCRKII